MKTDSKRQGKAYKQPIVVLYNKTDELIKGEARDLIADEGVGYCAQSVIRALESEGYQVIDLPYDVEVESVLVDYPPDQYVIFNLGEGLSGKILEEARIAWALEVMGYTFTGNGGDAIAKSTNKALTKSLLEKAGLKTPEWWVFSQPAQVQKLMARDIPFPLIVKPIAEDGSIGLNGSAVVHTLEGLEDRVSYINNQYRQAALAERFIVGRELNIGILGNPPKVLPIAEIDFSEFSDQFEQIVSFDAKWNEDSFEYHHTPSICPAALPASLTDSIKMMVLKAWDVIGCYGYARVDLRLDEQNIPYIVEVNCNPDISPNAGFHLAAQTAGFTYNTLINHILNNAWRRSNAYRQSRTKRTRTLNQENFQENTSFQQN
ncbi:MAG: ATP-grasp domain-containing protein [Gammaproteobacteria bacterium]|nr:ATP-grasp domain-containing protein [Gammaproteobacteria bacterium]